MLVQCQPGNGRLGDSQDATLVIRLSRDKIEAILVAGELATGVLLPIVDVLLG